MNTEHEFHVDSFVGYIENIKDKRDKHILVEFMLKFFKAAELRLRNEIVDEFKKKYADKIENNKLKIRENGYEVVIELVTNINLEEAYKKDKDLLNEHVQELTLDEQNCFEWKLTMNDSRYKQLKKLAAEEEKQYDLFDMVVETPGTPRLTIKRVM